MRTAAERIRAARALALAAAVLVALLGGTPARAQGVVLDDVRRVHLAGLPVLRGEPLASGSLAGRPVVVTFFASWCPPCRAEFTHLAALARVHRAELRVVAVNVFEAFDANDGPRLERFLRETAPPFTVVEGDERTRELFGRVSRIPTVFVFDGGGRPVLHFVHARGATKTTATPEELEAAVALALGAE